MNNHSPKTRQLFIALLIVLGVISLYPYKTTVVPAWKLRVVDAEGNPVKNMPVNYSWQNYSLESNGNEERTRTDENGYVSFPERTIRAALLQRMLGPVLNILQTGVHASFGSSGHIVVWGRPEEYETESLSYDGGVPPEKVVLRRVRK